MGESNRIPDEDKKNISSAIDKIKNRQAEDITDDEITAMRKWVAIKDQSGNPNPSKRKPEFYLADIDEKDWRFGNKSVGGGKVRQARKKVPVSSSGNESLYNALDELGKKIGLKKQPPTNSRTTSKMMAPTTINTKRKKSEITVKRGDNGNVRSATIAGQTHTKKTVPKRSDVEKALIKKGMDPDEARRKARSAVLGIQRYNDQIDLLAETAEASGGKLEVVDYGDVSTLEGRQNAISSCLQDVANGLEKALESTTPPNPPLTREHYELIEHIKNIKNPLDDPDWESLSFEEQQKRIEQFQQDMGEILLKMESLDDMKTSRAEVAEAITFMHRLSQGFNTILPASETFKVSDVYAIKDPGDTEDPKVLAESIQQILVDVQVSGGESVKYMKGAKSSSDAKVKLTVYKNKATRKSINTLLDSYDNIYAIQKDVMIDYIDSDGNQQQMSAGEAKKLDKDHPAKIAYAKKRKESFPPSQEILDKLDENLESVKKQTIEDGIMTKEEIGEVVKNGEATGEKAFDAMVKKNKKKLEEAGFDEEGLAQVKKAMAKHCAQGMLMAELNNRDTEYNKFNNVSHRISGGKNPKYDTKENDGINTISGMKFSCDQGFTVSGPPPKITPENTNPTEIVGIKVK